MTHKEENELSMYLAFKDFIATQTTITTPLPNFSTYLTSFLGCIDQIQKARDTQEGDKTGVADNKDSLRTSLVDAAYDVSLKLVAYAKVSKNLTLLNEVKYSVSKLNKSADTILYDRAHLLYNRANTNVSALSGYGITATTQTAYLKVINDYLAVIPKPALSRNDKKAATQTIKKNFEDANTALDHMIALADIVRLTQPVFYAAFHKAIVVPKSGIRALALRGRVIDTDGLPIAKVTVEIVAEEDADKPAGTTGVKKLKKKSTDKGNFHVKSLAEGIYVAKARKMGYEKLYVTFAIVPSQLKDLVMVMHGTNFES